MVTSLHHPCHEHALNQLELSRNCHVRCFLCALDLCGWAYCCFDCDIYLHESCASLPLQIQHPSHPEHSLNLSWYCLDRLHRCHGCDNSSDDCFIYSCDDCMFILDITCAVSSLPPPVGQRDEEIIWHFAHDHPLALFHVDKAIKLKCRACACSISGPTYGCRRCFFMLHESCAQLPREIPQHPFHNNRHALTLIIDSREAFKCKACAYGHRSTYRCCECEFKLDVGCAFSSLSLQDQQREDSMMIQHISHSHKLNYFLVAMDSNIRCKACLLKISDEVYGCTDCIFFLHKPCAELPQEVVHSLHPHPLYLEMKHLNLKSNFECLCCSTGRNLYEFFYSCHDCAFSLDIGCTQKILEEGVSLDFEIHHPFHEHPFVLHNFNGWHKLQCNACQHPIQGLGYISKESEHHSYYSPQYYLHISCTVLPQELEHPCHSKHPLKLRSLDGSFNCDACNRESKGYAFYCAECHFHLDVDCASHKPSLKHQLHEHELIYFQRTESLRCNRCGNKCNRDLYRCVNCNFNLHHGCVPLPLSAKHELHPHPLLLHDIVVDKSYDEHYCHLCETLRNPDHGVYYCEQCDYAAHIGCMIPIVEPKGIIEVQKPVLNKLDEEIASLEAGIKEMNIKLEALKRKRADMICPTLICQGDTEKPDSVQMKLPVYPSERTRKALTEIQQKNIKELQSCLKPVLGDPERDVDEAGSMPSDSSDFSE